MLVLYGLKSCDSCRKARKFLSDRNIEFRFHDFRDNGIDIQTIERWAERIGWEKLLNKRSLTWRKIPEVDRANMDSERAKATMLELPTLITRPVIESKKIIDVGFSEARYAELLGKTDGPAD